MKLVTSVVFTPILLALASLYVCGTALAIDIESFEFNDLNGTALASAANTANPGNQWSTPSGGADMLPSDVQSGSYRVIKDFDAFAQNHLDIDNIDSGTVYLTVTMSGWKFTTDGGLVDTAGPEEVRFAFMNTDGLVGVEITAQMQIRRNTTTGNIELFGDAFGTAGSTNLEAVAPLATEQTNPFTMVLALDLDSNSYEVFYKDGANPSQVLGLGAISRVRGANSIRFAVNNNLGSTNLYPTVIDEQANIDRIALTDTNPLTDLISLEVNRDTGAMTLVNTSGAAISNIESHSITSTVGGLDSTQWKTITGNYDSPGGSVDSDDLWMVDSSTKTELGESMQTGNGDPEDGGSLSISQSVVLDVSTASTPGVWIQSPFEDVHMVLNLAGGVSRTVDVNFVGNGGEKWAIADLDFDTDIDTADWIIFNANSETDLSAFSVAESYQRGDLDSDGINSVLDFGIFKDRFNTANGIGSFEAMIAGVPEPSCAVMACIAFIGVSVVRRKSY